MQTSSIVESDENAPPCGTVFDVRGMGQTSWVGPEHRDPRHTHSCRYLQSINQSINQFICQHIQQYAK